MLLSLWYPAQIYYAHSQRRTNAIQAHRGSISKNRGAPEACIMFPRYQNFLWGDKGMIQKIPGVGGLRGVGGGGNHLGFSKA